jgi:hypothetical protein
MRGEPKSGVAEWRRCFRDHLAAYGHRNWIVVADAAYPAQSASGIETVVSGCGQIEVLRHVLEDIAAAGHVTPIVYTDRELAFVPEQDAPGVTAFRGQLSELLGKRTVRELPHDQIIARLDEAGRVFRVLIVKTGMRIPYTSVFLELGCAYWDPDAERRLRSALGAPNTAPG